MGSVHHSDQIELSVASTVSSVASFERTTPSPPKQPPPQSPVQRKSKKLSEFPKFSGTIKDWISFERKFTSVTHAQGYSHVISDTLYNPTTKAELDEYRSDSQYIYNALALAWADGVNYYLVQTHEITMDGRAAFLQAKRYFRSEAITNNELQDSVSTLVKTKLEYNSPGGMQQYVATFNEALATMTKLGEPVHGKLLSLLFLSNIRDPQYDTIKDNPTISTMSLMDMQALFLKKCHAMAHITKQKQIHYTTTDHESTSEIDVITQLLTRLRPTSDTPRLPKDVYDNLDPAVKDFIRTLRDYYRSRHTDKSEPTVTQRTQNMTMSDAVPTVAAPIGTPIGIGDTTTVLSESNDVMIDVIRQFLTRTRQQHISSRSLFYTDTSLNGRLVLDNAADTCSASPALCHIVTTSDNYVTVDGCHPGVKKGYRLCTAVTALDTPSGTLLLGVREATLIPDSKIMLLSELQIRSHGVIVDSIPRRFGGSGTIKKDEVTITFHLTHGLMTHAIRKPNPTEFENIDITWLTSASPWDPSSLNEDATIRSSYLSEITVPPVLGEPNDAIDLGGSLDQESIPDSDSEQEKIDQLLGTSHPKPRYEKYRSFLLHRPLQVIQKTFKCTTRYAAKLYGSHNMHRHFKSRFPILNRHRLHETFCTDTWFSSTTAIHGYTCVQIFYGTTSRYISVYPMHKEADGPSILEDFVRTDGAPFKLKSDNSQMQSSDAWVDICRKYNISQTYTEPHHPHQTHAERAIQEVKRLVNSIMDKTGSPDNLWAFCTRYVVYILNRMAHPDLEWRTPLEKCFGETPDISNILHHCFFDKVLYYCPYESFPTTKEKIGRFIGFAENTGDALTYVILTEDDEVLHRSVVRTASDNIRAYPSDTIQKDRFLRLTDLTSSNCPTFTIDDVINYDTTHATRVEPTHEPAEEAQPLNDNVDHTYEEAMDDQDDDENRLWRISRLVDYRDDKNKRELQVLWETGEVTWEPYGVIKKYAPLQVALFAERENLLNYDAWKWAKTYVRKHKRTIRVLRAHYVKVQGRTYRFQFGIRIPISISEALRLDEQNGNSLWREAIDKEIDKIIDYEVFKPVDAIPAGYQRIPCHMVFAVKVDGRHKARLVAGGNLTLLDPGEDAYSSVAESTSVRLAMLIAQLNDLLGVSIDIENAYLHGITKELVYTTLDSSYGPELTGKILIVVKGLYGLKTSGARFHESLSDTLLSMGFRPSRANADLWMKECDNHYEYVIRYVDDLLIFSRSPATIVDKLREVYNLKGGSTPDYFLGADIKSYTDKNGNIHRAISAHTYIQNICAKIETLTKSPLKSYDSPMAPSDHPELDDSSLVDPEDHGIFRMLIGSAQWVISLGRLDIMYAVSVLSRYCNAPRYGHLSRALRIFGYLKAHAKLSIIIDASDHIVPNMKTPLNNVNWDEQYPGVREELPPDAPLPKGKPLKITCYSDSDHAGDLVTRRSTTGILLFVNNTPIKWYSKRQNTIESSTYGSELVSLRIATELVMEFRYRLRMMGVPLQGSSVLLCDNRSSVLNVSLPSSTLKKRHNAIAYHRVRESVAAKIVSVSHIDGKENLSDILTKAVDGATFKRHTHTTLKRM